MEEEIIIEEVGTKLHYEDYHCEYYLGGELIARSDYDSKQGLHIATLPGEHRRFYAKTPKGIKFKLSCYFSKP